MKIYKEILVASENRTELDSEFPFYEDPEQEERNEVIGVDLNFGGDVPSMSIFELRDMLNRFIKKGAQRIYIAEHEDHRGYYFNAVKLEEKKD